MGFVEQLVGSNTISGTIITQGRLGAFNFLALGVICLWALSPVGSYASLRVLYIEPTMVSSDGSMKAMNPFSIYNSALLHQNSQTTTTTSNGLQVKGLFASALVSASAPRQVQSFQDPWGNIKIPMLESLPGNPEDSASNWIDVPLDRPTTFTSLVGVPISPLPQVGNTSFVMPTSYLKVSCPIFDKRTVFTNVSFPREPGPLPDCHWDGVRSTFVGDAAFIFMMSHTGGCGTPSNGDLQQVTGSRNGTRTVVFESSVMNGSVSHAQCGLTTTYVDLKVDCAAASCHVSSIRPIVQPPRHKNWTAFDLDDEIRRNFLLTFSQMFPTETGVKEPPEPIVQYLGGLPITSFKTADFLPLGVSSFETRLSQLLNTQYLIGISPQDIAGTFSGNGTIDSSLTRLGGAALSFNVTQFATTATIFDRDVIRCSISWLVILLLSSAVVVATAIAAAVVRSKTLVPDVLGTVALAILDNRCGTAAQGASGLDGLDKARGMKMVRLRLGDVQPERPVGKIGLGLVGDGHIANIAVVRADREYE